MLLLRHSSVPLTRGSGPRLFVEDAEPGKDNGVVYLNERAPA
jgi:hypothetical protein